VEETGLEYLTGESFLIEELELSLVCLLLLKRMDCFSVST
jgi:hypothetical protein